MELMRLRIPAGWWVVKNAFLDVDPNPDNWEPPLTMAFIEDILSLEYRFPWQEAGDDEGYVVDLGWYPDQDPNGSYKLVLLHKDWDDILATYDHRDRLIVRDKLETWLDLVVRAADRTEIERLLRKSKRDAETS